MCEANCSGGSRRHRPAACGGCFFYNGIVLRLNIDTLLNLDPRGALRLSEDDSAKL